MVYCPNDLTSLKKADLHAADVKSYQSITNLSVVSMLLGRLVEQPLVKYLTENCCSQIHSLPNEPTRRRKQPF